MIGLIYKIINNLFIDINFLFIKIFITSVVKITQHKIIKLINYNSVFFQYVM
jgi:hypothetical protein